MKKITSILMVFSVSAIYALGTDAGTEISNTATLSYSAGGVKQPDVDSNDDTFKVDKKIDMVLSTDDTDQIEVTPGQEDRITSYTFKNEGNANQKFKFEVANLANDQEADYDSDKDNDDVQNLEIKCTYTDGDGNEQTADWAPSFVIEIKEDTEADCEVRADINDPDDTPGEQDEGYGDDGDIMNVELKATAYKDDTTAETETTGDDTQDTVDVVFADGESVQNGATSGLGDTASDDNSTKGDTAGDGIEVARSGYIISTPVLTVTKSSCVLSDPVNNTDKPKRIPGAIVRYLFDIKNTGTSDVEDLNISDSFDDNLDLSSTVDSVKKTESQDNACVCTTEGTTDASGDTTVDGQDLKITNINVAAGSTQDESGEKHTCVTLSVEIK